MMRDTHDISGSRPCLTICKDCGPQVESLPGVSTQNRILTGPSKSKTSTGTGSDTGADGHDRSGENQVGARDVLLRSSPTPIYLTWLLTQMIVAQHKTSRHNDYVSNQASLVLFLPSLMSPYLAPSLQDDQPVNANRHHKFLAAARPSTPSPRDMSISKGSNSSTHSLMRMTTITIAMQIGYARRMGILTRGRPLQLGDTKNRSSQHGSRNRLAIRTKTQGREDIGSSLHNSKTASSVTRSYLIIYLSFTSRGDWGGLQ
ncbi:hypothetical protein B0T10DRAFT_305812 [Thelonectria olida]|uniref:Uncharacterized protein n=1 Tax=Thelonectria olida TaxID=1576542 RepID=A0A9P9ARH2_9HYPO|nr:hypothetical protein B0T10DRAFT_305812 [Thelonectria olida]